ncbi:acetylxylan esterase [Salinispora arenicola]|uniref:Acetylxylan esterase n=1 Tax=Salinispora arenicola TaxID=168697 RepID=A0A542XQU5_SALAC|nr:acetylxylan esterase [Salinispora arenicola]TQL38209.1 cephalosporin-C deacetylase [Salinispora arenicola]GIM87812.1 acetylxylan esterase [Salinispora arenicola]
MTQFDMPLDQLRAFRYDETEPADFDVFWAKTLGEVRHHELDVVQCPVDTRLRTVTVDDVAFNGFGGDRVRAWLVRPAGLAGPLPAVVEFIGYGGGRGLPHEKLLWASAGFAHLVVDTRGQGGLWSVADTPDPYGTGSSAPGFLTRGISSPEDYYYRRVFSDGVRAVEAVRTLPVVDASRVIVTGSSQGGAIALAVSGLVPDIAGVAARSPFLCAIRRAVAVTDSDPYAELRRFLGIHRHEITHAFGVLGYFDGVFMARRARRPGWFSAGLMDDVCPPSSVFAAANEFAGPVHVEVWPYNGHEGGGVDDDRLLLDWGANLVAGPDE